MLTCGDSMGIGGLSSGAETFARFRCFNVRTSPQNLHDGEVPRMSRTACDHIRCLLVLVAFPAVANAATPDVLETAAAVDRLIATEHAAAGIEPVPVCNDEDFLRRSSYDLTGKLPSPGDVTLFAIDPDPAKRAARIEQFVATREFAANWARYWRDVIYSRATEMRTQGTRPVFEEWMTEQLAQGRGWDEITTDLLTATGNIRENGATGLMAAHAGAADEVASEVSRIFLGIQIQCANCHDHPTDQWTRDDFHTLAAFFPRMRFRRVEGEEGPRSFEVVSFDPPAGRRGMGPGGNRPKPEQIFRRFDRDNDGRLIEAELEGSKFAPQFARFLERGDENDDKALSKIELEDVFAELEKMPNPRRQAEYFMPDLMNPASPGTKIDPAFFVTKTSLPAGQTDLERRKAIAELITSDQNPWFAKSYVNRIWSEMLGRGFYMPVDDLGPGRTPDFPEVLELLSTGFAQSGFDTKWLAMVIANTQTYQRSARPSEAAAEMQFAACMPTRLRSDQIFDSLAEVLQFNPDEPKRTPRLAGGGPRAGRTPRDRIAKLFEYDPSTPQEDVTGTIPQALFMMNSPELNNLIKGTGKTRLAGLLKEYPNDDDAIRELYLIVLSREPAAAELETCREHINASETRPAAYEDLLWSLINSAEFLTKR